MRWRILNKIKDENKVERREEIVKALFKNRGLKTLKQQKEFLSFKDPYRLTPKKVGIASGEIKKAITRIKKAIKGKEKIIVYGDYDTDGVCATAVMWEAINKLGGEVMPFIPKREEGYGLRVDRINGMAEDGVSLIITVDQGIVHPKQIKHAKRVGIDVIVTDHHLAGKEKPKAVAIIHTTKLAGVGVAWFLAKSLGVKSGLDLAAIGTVTDMVPLLGPNRSIVKDGLKKLLKTDRPGLQSLYDFASLTKDRMGTYEVGFIIGPRLNAAGRMGDSMESLRLICTKDEARAIGLAQGIDQKNRERKDLLEQSVVHARKLWLKEKSQKALIFIHHPSYSEGVIGLIASRLTEEFYRPAVVVAEGKEWSKASARSVEEFNIVKAIRTYANLLGDHGGHPRAAGFSVKTKNIKNLKKKLVDLAEKELGKDQLKPTLKIDAEINLKDIDLELYKKLERFSPFGMENRQPVFAVRKVKVLEAKTVGAENQHLKLKVKQGDSKEILEAIGFGMGEFYKKFDPQKEMDLAFILLLNEWNGKKNLQLKLKDIKLQRFSFCG